jgi:hypothetical protein
MLRWWRISDPKVLSMSFHTPRQSRSSPPISSPLNSMIDIANRTQFKNERLFKLIRFRHSSPRQLECCPHTLRRDSYWCCSQVPKRSACAPHRIDGVPAKSGMFPLPLFSPATTATRGCQSCMDFSCIRKCTVRAYLGSTTLLRELAYHEALCAIKAVAEGLH